MGRIFTKTELNKNIDKNHKLACCRCGSASNHVVLQSVEVSAYEEVYYHNGDINQPETIDWIDNYQIVKCQGCDAISFRHSEYFSERQFYYGPDDSDNGWIEHLYPERRSNVLGERHYVGIPEHVRNIYSEVIRCYNEGCVILCAAGLRSIVEAVCKHYEITDGPVEVLRSGEIKVQRKGDLRGKIAGLHEKGILTKQNADVLHEHRFLGNDALHELTTPSKSALKLAIEIIEHILTMLYELPKMTLLLQEERQK